MQSSHGSEDTSVMRPVRFVDTREDYEAFRLSRVVGPAWGDMSQVAVEPPRGAGIGDRLEKVDVGTSPQSSAAPTPVMPMDDHIVDAVMQSLSDAFLHERR